MSELCAGKISVEQPDEPISYWIDNKDNIVKVSNSWNRFAMNNKAGDKTLKHNVIGKRIYSFIVGDSTRMYIDVLIQQARILGRSLSRKYRCDSPELKRYMEMCLTPEADGIVRFDHTLYDVEPYKQAISFRNRDSSEKPSVCRCSVCARLKIGDIFWMSPEEAIEQNLILSTELIPVCYLVCPACESHLSEELKL